MAGKRKYRDLRYLFMRGLIQRERWQRTRQYLKSAAECTSRAIVSLELADSPIKSVSQAKTLEGIGGETLQRLKEIQEKKEKSMDRPNDGKFVSSAGAILVSLLDLVEQVERSGSDDVALIPEEVLKCETKSLCEEIFLGDDTGFCQAWWRVEVLIKRGLIKRRQQHKESVYQLMELGRHSANMLRRDRDAVFPKSKPVKSPRSFPPQQKSAVTKLLSQSQENFLYTNDIGSDGYDLLLKENSPVLPSCPYSVSLSTKTLQSAHCLLRLPLSVTLTLTRRGVGSGYEREGHYNPEVDTQEMGGDKVGLGEHCKRLERAGVRYRSCRLKCGDYRWVWRCDGGEMTIPLLMERKRADDIANSLKDGRFWRQVTKMVEWKEDFRQKDISARLSYIIEGDPGDYVVKCGGDVCQGSARCGEPTLAQVQLAMKDLEEHPELEVRHTSCVEATVQYLAVTSQEIQKRASKGEYDMLIVNRFRERNAPSTKHNSTEVEESGIKQDNNSINHKPQTECTDLVLEIEDDSQEIQARDSPINNIPCDNQDSKELPPLDHNPKTLCSKNHISSSASNPRNGVCVNIPIDSKSAVNIKENDKTIHSRIPVEDEVNAVFDIDTELAIFSSSSEHGKTKRMFTDNEHETDCSASKKFLSPPLKKLKFNCGADCIEIPQQISHVSPCHGKVYLMKRNRKTQVSRRLSECDRNKVDPVESEAEAAARTCVELSPRRADVSSSPGCSGVEANSHSCDREESESRTDDNIGEKLTVKMTFDSKLSNRDQQGPSTELPSIANLPGTSNIADKEEYSGKSILEKDILAQQSDSDDSLPEVDIGQMKELPELPELMPHPVPSTSAAAAEIARPDSKHYGAQELDIAVHSTSKVSSKRGRKSPRGRRKQLIDDDDDDDDDEAVQSVSRPSNKRRRKSTQSRRKQLMNEDVDDVVDDQVVIDLNAEDDTEFCGRRQRKRRSGGRSKTENRVDETLVLKVADILPQCGKQQIKAALVKCQMNVEQTVMELLDAVPQDGDVVDLT
ncbi:LOW QUALITY PROTEIN: uncharacterized protein LOC124261131 [Haliotis rubra]|uniref:LOW QUALITY PROTEIN: uncharacterized protein LOC124261131 n=1 Tax=Haliotis rubra TaxID=36100 RepID=UPI001EE50EA4|nr:LOW QUALITY PROTEIN: uncharacterized protein LOC124261131 [Haliotis rubra]